MATYKYDAYVAKSTSTAFDGALSPGNAASHSGIYRCLGCGREVTSEEGNPLPPQNHHQHSTDAKILWRLIAYADHKPKA